MGDYEPFGDGWEREMMKFNKVGLVSMLREELKIKADLRELVDEMKIDEAQSIDANQWHHDAVKQWRERLEERLKREVE